jgi:protein ImuB
VQSILSVTPDPPDGMFIDVAGSTHLFHGEIALMEDLCKRLEKAGISGRAAISDTPGCSWAVARYGENMHVPPGRASEAIASLPVASLRIAPRTVPSLHEVGIERVAHLASKPRSSLHLRFGGEVLLRLDQAMGSAAEVLTSLVPPEAPRSELRFAEPLSDPEDLKCVIERLCEDLCRDLETRGVGARAGSISSFCGSTISRRPCASGSPALTASPGILRSSWPSAWCWSTRDLASRPSR